MSDFNYIDGDVNKDENCNLPWNGPKQLNGQLKTFLNAILEEGMSKRDAAIKAGVAEGNASVYASRWSHYTIVQNYIDACYRQDVKAHKERLYSAITGLMKIAHHPKANNRDKIAALSKVMDFYKDTVVAEDSLSSTTVHVMDALADKIKAPVDVRTESDLYGEEE